jgi:hypothetical protein
MPTRRAVLLLPMLVAACAGDSEPATAPVGPLDFTYLLKLPLNVAAVTVTAASPVPPMGDIGVRLAPTPDEAVRMMGRERLVAVGTTGEARFTVTQAAMIQLRDSLTCLLACRLEILSAEGAAQGFIEAQARRVVQGSDAARPGAPDALLRQAMGALNVEFEYQARRALKDWLVRAPAGEDGTPVVQPPGEVMREDLPKE